MERKKTDIERIHEGINLRRKAYSYKLSEIALKKINDDISKYIHQASSIKREILDDNVEIKYFLTTKDSDECVIQIKKKRINASIS